MIADAESVGDLELVNRLEARYWLDGVGQPEGRAPAAARALFLAMNDIALRRDPVGEDAVRRPAWPELHRITVPTLVVVGEHDLPGMIQLGERLAQALPNGHLTVMPETAHCPSLDQPERFGRLVADFVDGLDQG